MEGKNKLGLAPGLEKAERVHHPVVGMHDVRAFMPDDATKCPQYLWIGEWW